MAQLDIFPDLAQPKSTRNTKRKPIPYTITHGANRPIVFVEIWPGRTAAGDAGTGFVRTFDGTDWVRAACYITELESGRLSGGY